MRMFKIACKAVAFSFLVSCGSPQTAGPVAGAAAMSDTAPAWLDNPSIEFDPEEYVTAFAQAPLRNDAATRAEQLLWRTVWQSEELVPDAVLAFQSEIQVLERTYISGRQAHVLVAVARDEIEGDATKHRDDLTLAQSLEPSTPREQIQQAIDVLRHTSTLAAICRLQHTWVGNCGDLDEDAAQKNVVALAQRIRLASAHPFGLPTSPTGQPLAPLTVVATWLADDGEITPIAELPLAIEADKGVVQAVAGYSQSNGAFSTHVFKKPEKSLTVRVDAWELLRNQAALWPPITVTVALRALTPTSTRIAVALNESGPESLVGSSLARAAIVANLRERARTVVEFSDSDNALVEDLPARAPNLWPKGHELDACPDVIAVGQADSEFINRMGARSVWHEARGTLVVYDAWTGKELGRLSETVQAVGVGDDNAAQKALAELGKTLAQKLDALIETAFTQHQAKL